MLRNRLFERVLVLRGGAAAVDRVEGRLLLAGWCRNARGAGLAGERVVLDPFKEEFGVLVLSSYYYARFNVFGRGCSFFERWTFPIIGIQGGHDSRRTVTGAKAWKTRS